MPRNARPPSRSISGMRTTMKPMKSDARSVHGEFPPLLRRVARSSFRRRVFLGRVECVTHRRLSCFVADVPGECRRRRCRPRPARSASSTALSMWQQLVPITSTKRPRFRRPAPGTPRMGIDDRRADRHAFPQAQRFAISVSNLPRRHRARDKRPGILSATTGLNWGCRARRKFARIAVGAAPHPLVAGLARATRGSSVTGAADQLPDKPVSGFQPHLAASYTPGAGSSVFSIFRERTIPARSFLRSGQGRLPAVHGRSVDPVRLRLGAVMFPQFRPGQRFVGEPLG